ncbi:MAG: hypothetical protein K6G30_05580 [Acetatifactor sp.]|nr:hypothetical protein [Acetatifactor sp.]
MKAKRVIIGTIFGVIIGGITLIAILYMLLVWFFTGGPPKKTRGAEHYEEILGKYVLCETGGLHAGLMCFPDSIPMSAFSDGKEPTFYFSYQDTWDEPTCEGYLYCEYDEEDYRAEVERLSTTKKVYPKGTKTLIQDEEGRFQYPVYMAIDHSDFAYEYAILPGNNTIAYIYTAFYNKEDEMRAIPKEYLPVDFDDTLTSERGSGMDLSEGYNLYFYPNSRSNCDYSRKENVQ